MIATLPRAERRTFGYTRDGKKVTSFTLRNSDGVQAEVLDYGGIVRALHVPDRHGHPIDVVLGYDDLASYVSDRSYLGALIGRFANRIRGGTFVLDGKAYKLATNNGPNHLHGGDRGFDKVVWHARPFEKGDAVGVTLNHASPDGDEGYPGNLEVRVTYALAASNVFSVEYRATTDKATPVNLTHHGYFNLSGEGASDILEDELTINAEFFTEIDADLVPTGTIVSLVGTPLDFRGPTRIGARIDENHEQLRFAGGYDHNFVLPGATGELSLAARVFSPATGITMEVFTTEPGMQFYSGNFLDNAQPGKHGHAYDRRAALCLETQHFPDSPNHAGFPSTILRPGAEFYSRTEFRFSAR